jgi:hypothetical protein
MGVLTNLMEGPGAAVAGIESVSTTFEVLISVGILDGVDPA